MTLNDKVRLEVVIEQKDARIEAMRKEMVSDRAAFFERVEELKAHWRDAEDKVLMYSEKLLDAEHRNGLHLSTIKYLEGENKRLMEEKFDVERELEKERRSNDLCNRILDMHMENKRLIEEVESLRARAEKS